jgi:hypothetical protein
LAGIDHVEQQTLIADRCQVIGGVAPYLIVLIAR